MEGGHPGTPGRTQHFAVIRIRNIDDPIRLRILLRQHGYDEPTWLDQNGHATNQPLADLPHVQVAPSSERSLMDHSGGDLPSEECQPEQQHQSRRGDIIVTRPSVLTSTGQFLKLPTVPASFDGLARHHERQRQRSKDHKEQRHQHACSPGSPQTPMSDMQRPPIAVPIPMRTTSVVLPLMTSAHSSMPSTIPKYPNLEKARADGESPRRASKLQVSSSVSPSTRPSGQRSQLTAHPPPPPPAQSIFSSKIPLSVSDSETLPSLDNSTSMDIDISGGASADAGADMSARVWVSPAPLRPRGKKQKPHEDPTVYYTCTICKNRILGTRVSNLQNHVRRHSTLKQFQCCYCDYAHNEIAKVKLHMTNNHKDSDSAPVNNLNEDMRKIWRQLFRECFPNRAQRRRGMRCSNPSDTGPGHSSGGGPSGLARLRRTASASATTVSSKESDCPNPLVMRRRRRPRRPRQLPDAKDLTEEKVELMKAMNPNQQTNLMLNSDCHQVTNENEINGSTSGDDDVKLNGPNIDHLKMILKFMNIELYDEMGSRFLPFFDYEKKIC